MKVSASLDRIGIILPATHEIQGLADAFRDRGLNEKCRVDEIPLPRGTNARALRRTARLTRLALYASDSAYRDAPVTGTDSGLFVGVTHGTTSLLKEFHDYLYEYGPDSASPNAFSNGVTNAPMSAISRHLGITGGGCTLVGRRNVGLEVLRHAALSLSIGEHKQCLAGAAEEYSELVENAYRGCVENRNGRGGEITEPMGEGAVFVRLSRADRGGVLYTPLDKINGVRPDLIVTDLSVDALRNGGYRILRRGMGATPEIAFPALGLGSVFGNLNAVSSMLSVAVAWDIMVRGGKYPSELLAGGRLGSSSIPDKTAICSILIASFGSDGSVSYGWVSHSEESGR